MIWTAFARKLGKIVAFVIGYKGGLQCAIDLYNKAKAAVGSIACIFTDANSVYDVAFRRYCVPESHVIGKSQTHRIESTNSSLRDNLARLNRKSKRYSKSYEMLECTLKLFFHYKTFTTSNI